MSKKDSNDGKEFVADVTGKAYQKHSEMVAKEIKGLSEQNKDATSEQKEINNDLIDGLEEQEYGFTPCAFLELDKMSQRDKTIILSAFFKLNNGLNNDDCSKYVSALKIRLSATSEDNINYRLIGNLNRSEIELFVRTLYEFWAISDYNEAVIAAIEELLHNANISPKKRNDIKRNVENEARFLGERYKYSFIENLYRKIEQFDSLPDEDTALDRLNSVDRCDDYLENESNNNNDHEPKSNLVSDKDLYPEIRETILKYKDKLKIVEYTYEEESDKRKGIEEIIKTFFGQNGNSQYNIESDIRNRAPGVNPYTIVGFNGDLFKKPKRSILFTTSTVYLYDSEFKKPIEFNYLDIDELRTTPKSNNKRAILIVKLRNGEKITVSDASYNISEMEKLLVEIKNLDDKFKAQTDKPIPIIEMNNSVKLNYLKIIANVLSKNVKKYLEVYKLAHDFGCCEEDKKELLIYIYDIKVNEAASKQIIYKRIMELIEEVNEAVDYGSIMSWRYSLLQDCIRILYIYEGVEMASSDKETLWEISNKFEISHNKLEQLIPYSRISEDVIKGNIKPMEIEKLTMNVIKVVSNLGMTILMGSYELFAPTVLTITIPYVLEGIFASSIIRPLITRSAFSFIPGVGTLISAGLLTYSIVDMIKKINKMNKEFSKKREDSIKEAIKQYESVDIPNYIPYETEFKEQIESRITELKGLLS